MSRAVTLVFPIAASDSASGFTEVLGRPPAELVVLAADARQHAPLVPGSVALDAVAPGSLGGMAMLAAPGTLERRHDLALMLRALAPGAPFCAVAPKTMGGARLARELTAFGCDVSVGSKRHYRACAGRRPSELAGLDAAIAGGAPRLVADLGLWSQPGVFSWDRIDPGSALLLEALPPLSGRGADLGCGIGVLAHGVLASPDVEALALIDIDRRACEAARRNVDDRRATVAWADLRTASAGTGLDFVVANPPFHEAGHEDRTLGQLFIRRAAEALRTGGQLWLTANRHLPYEGVLKPLFRRVDTTIEAHGYKVLRALR